MTTQTGMDSYRFFQKYSNRLPKGPKTDQTGMTAVTDTGLVDI